MSIERAREEAQRQQALGRIAIAFLFWLLVGCSPQVAPEVSESRVESGEVDPWYTARGMFPGSERPEYSEELELTHPNSDSLAKHGAYLVRSVAACGFCHAPNSSVESPLSGGAAVRHAYGIAVAPNITPSEDKGIAGWTVSDIISVFRSRTRPDGSQLSDQVHSGYRWLSNEDARAIAVYLLTQPPAANTASDGTTEERFRFFSGTSSVKGYIPSLASRQATEGYGRYLVHQVAQCQICHNDSSSKERPDSALKGSSRLSGASIYSRIASILLEGVDAKEQQEFFPELLSNESQQLLGLKTTSEEKELEIVIPPGAPNIRGSGGISQWSESDILRYLTTGLRPDGSFVSSQDCPWEFYQEMNSKDKQAISAYLKSL